MYVWYACYVDCARMYLYKVFLCYRSMCVMRVVYVMRVMFFSYVTYECAYGMRVCMYV